MAPLRRSPWRALDALLGAALVLVGCAPALRTPQALDTGDERVVAEVNGVPIPASRLEAVVDAERIRRGAAESSVEQEREIREGALELLIRSELVYQAAVKRRIKVSDAAIDEELRVLRSQFPGDAEYQAYLHESGVTPDDVRSEARRRSMMRSYIDSVVDSVVTEPARARKLYDQSVDRIPAEEQVRVAQILVRLRPDDPEDRRRAARVKIEEAHRRALAGEDFAELARRYSESPLAERGGDMGFIPRGRMLPSFEDVAFATPVGQISPIFETPHGLNVVKVLEHRDSRKPGFEEVQAGLLLVLLRERRDAALREHVDQLERRANIRRLE